MGLTLKRAFQFSVSDRRAFVLRRTDGCAVAAIEPLEVMLIEETTRSRSINACRREIVAKLGPTGVAALDSMVSRLRPLFQETAHVDDALNELPPYSELRSHPPGSMRMLPGPKILHWSVTNRCPRRCVYCYAEPQLGSRADDSTLARSRLRFLMVEAAELGAAGILLSGSEPFLRADLPEIIGDVRTAGLETPLTTKHPISRELAERLAVSGLDTLALSVDTIDPVISRSVIGSSAYPNQVLRSISNLRRAGLSFSIQAVVTPQTIGRIDDLAAFAERHEAIAFQLVPFEPVRRPIRPIDQSSLKVSLPEVQRTIDTIKHRHPALKVTLFEKVRPDACDELHCDIGGTKLFFTPSGRVHRCYKLTDDETLFGPDLRVHSIAAAWHDRLFAHTLVPKPADYADTPCRSCGSAGRCNATGRCIFQAALDYGRYAAPDRDCHPSRAWRSPAAN